MTNETYHPRGELIHGYAPREHPDYAVWAGIKARCNDPKSPAYKDYGGRGITYCERWKDFKNFAEDMGLRDDPELMIERLDNNGNYEPSNCIWADRSQQMHNRRIFKNNTTGYKGINLSNGFYLARYQDKLTRYSLGYFSSLEDAYEYREYFIDLYKDDKSSALNVLSRKVRNNSTTGVKGITKHTDGGYIVRKNIDGVRKYLGYTKSFEEAVNIIDAQYDNN